ncbi:MAG TPA: penicillin acylase family protein [Steroidobacteraceae bacterium]
MRILSRIVLGFAVLVLLAAGAVYLAIRGSLPPIDGEQAGAGLGAEAVIERDALGAVTITGRTREDVAYATGFAHAQDRYFQMDLARRMSAGRLAELVGDAALETDARNRLHRFENTAGQVFAALPAPDRALLESYARGVNAGLASLTVRPFEYLLLRQKPQPWRPEDSLLVVFTMYLQLNDSEASADRQRGLLAAALPAEVFRYVYSVAPAWEAPIDGVVMAAAPMPDPATFDLRRYASEAERMAALPAPATERENSAVGSNNWAVDGRHTKSGAALLANDMHLGLGVPNTWYRVRLLVADPAPAARRDLMGLTLPGAPIMVVGSNGHIAWGFTNSYGDWSDLVRVERSADGTRYRSAAGWKPIKRVIETLRSSSGKTRDLVIEQTEWGPLLPASNPPAGSDAFALAWTAQDPAATNLDWTRLETTPDCATALPVANSIGGPAQNFVCADAAGNIGWTLLGHMPLRGTGYDPGVPSDWTLPGAGWQGWREPGTYPRVLNPAAGRIWTANNRVVGAERLQAIGDGSPDRGARAQQIRDDLFALPPGSATEADMLRIQLDDRALFLVRWRDFLLTTLDDAAVAGHPARAAFREQAAAWDPRAATDAVGYRLVRTFHEVLERRVFDALVLPARVAHPDSKFKVPRQFEEAVWELATTRPAHLLDPRYRDWQAYLLDTVDEAVRDVGKDCADPTFATCTWGEANATRIQHPLSRAIPLLARWLDMPRVPMSGDHDMPQVHAPGFGASERFAVAPGHEQDGYFHMPGGQSGHPLSPFYRAGHEAWVTGERLPYLPGPAAHTLTLRPEAGPGG